MPGPLDFRSSPNAGQFGQIYNSTLGQTGGFGQGPATARSLVNFLNEYFGGGFNIIDTGSAGLDDAIARGDVIQTPDGPRNAQELLAETTKAYEQSLLDPGGWAQPPLPPTVPPGGRGGNKVIGRAAEGGGTIFENADGLAVTMDVFGGETPFSGSTDTGQVFQNGQSVTPPSVPDPVVPGVDPLIDEPPPEDIDMADSDNIFEKLFGSMGLSGLGSLILGMGGDLFKEFSPTGSTNRNLTNSITDLNRSKIPVDGSPDRRRSDEEPAVGYLIQARSQQRQLPEPPADVGVGYPEPDDGRQRTGTADIE
jgi:hypothetical protein